MTDVGFGVTADMQAKDHSDDADTYKMIFGYRSDGNIIPEWLGMFPTLDKCSYVLYYIIAVSHKNEGRL